MKKMDSALVFSFFDATAHGVKIVNLRITSDVDGILDQLRDSHISEFDSEATYLNVPSDPGLYVYTVDKVAGDEDGIEVNGTTHSATLADIRNFGIISLDELRGMISDCLESEWLSDETVMKTLDASIRDMVDRPTLHQTKNDLELG